MLYFASCCLRRFTHANQAKTTKSNPEYALLTWCIQDCLHKFWVSLQQVLANFPNKWIGIFLRMVVMPFGVPIGPPKDNLDKKVANIFTKPNSLRTSLLSSVYINNLNNNEVGKLEQVFN